MIGQKSIKSFFSPASKKRNLTCSGDARDDVSKTLYLLWSVAAGLEVICRHISLENMNESGGALFIC